MDKKPAATESIVVPTGRPIAIAVPTEGVKGKGNTGSKGKEIKLGRRGATLATRGYQKEAAGEFLLYDTCAFSRTVY